MSFRHSLVEAYFRNCGDECEACLHSKKIVHEDNQVELIGCAVSDGDFEADECPAWGRIERRAYEDAAAGGDPTKPGWVA